MDHLDYFGEQITEDDHVIIPGGWEAFKLVKVQKLTDKMVVIGKGSRKRYIYSEKCIRASPEFVTMKLLKKKKK